MPFKPWIRSISPLAWCLGISAACNVVTAGAALYIAFGTPRVYVRDGVITAYPSSNEVSINDRFPVRVKIVP